MNVVLIIFQLSNEYTETCQRRRGNLVLSPGRQLSLSLEQNLDYRPKSKVKIAELSQKSKEQVRERDWP